MPQISRLAARAASGLTSPTTSRTTAYAAAAMTLSPSTQSTNLFSTHTGPLLAYKQPILDPPIPRPSSVNPEIPAYPFGPARVYKQSNTGLYGSQRIQFGNRVSERNEIKNRRKWRPNVQRKRLYSEALGCSVQTRVTARVLRTIDKAGGLDEYLLGSNKTQRLRDLGVWGWKLRWRLMQSEKVAERFAKEREALGLPPAPVMSSAADGAVVAESSEDAAVLKEIGHTTDSLMAETDAMIREGGEFPIGEQDGKVGEKEATVERPFMQEEKP